MRHTLALLAVMATPALSEPCPDAPDISAELSQLINAARAAQDEATGRAASDAMWQLWLQAPDPKAQDILDRGMRQRAAYDFAGARDSFSALVAYCPAFAEGYNQRAFVDFLNGNYADALADLDRALDLSPDHVGAQSGRALSLMHLGRTDEARAQLEAALANNPWLSERHLMAPGAILARPGQEL